MLERYIGWVRIPVVNDGRDYATPKNPNRYRRRIISSQTTIRMAKQSRRKFSSEFKTKVVLETLKERHTLESLAKTYELHPNQITTWKKEFLSRASTVFDSKAPDAAGPAVDPEKLYAQIGQLKVENDFLKKKLS